MADDLTPPFTGGGTAGTPIATDDLGGGRHVQRMKTGWGPDGSLNDADVASGKPLPVQLRGSDGTDRSNAVLVVGNAVTVTTDITKSTTTTTYTVGDNWADSATAPVAGGYTFTGCGRASGGSGIITDAVVSCSVGPALPLQGEIWILDGAWATNDNDNAAFTCVDADVLLLVGVIPFNLAPSAVGAANAYAHVQGLQFGYTCVGSANLRFKVKVQNAYVNTASEVLRCRIKCVQTS